MFYRSLFAEPVGSYCNMRDPALEWNPLKVLKEMVLSQVVDSVNHVKTWRIILPNWTVQLWFIYGYNGRQWNFYQVRLNQKPCSSCEFVNHGAMSICFDCYFISPTPKGGRFFFFFYVYQRGFVRDFSSIWNSRTLCCLARKWWWWVLMEQCFHWVPPRGVNENKFAYSNAILNLKRSCFWFGDLNVCVFGSVTY